MDTKTAIKIDLESLEGMARQDVVNKNWGSWPDHVRDFNKLNEASKALGIDGVEMVAEVPASELSSTMGMGCGTSAEKAKFSEIISKTSRLLQRVHSTLTDSKIIIAKSEGPIFIGHGHSPIWKDLKDFLKDRLRLDHEEFNRVPVAGRSNKERLLEMLDNCCFAFLVVTGEDLRPDGLVQARLNVVHEVGLFQGRYGFEKAVVLLEDGCDEFSNIEGIGQLRFPKGNIMAKAEEIRRVLEREGILPTH